MNRKEVLEKKNKIISHSSASQVKTFKSCNRKWFYDKVKGFPWTGSEATRRGTAIHHAIEHYIAYETVLDVVYVDVETGRVAAEGEEHEVARFVESVIDFLEDVTVISVEEKMTLKTFPGGTTWIGYIDVLAADRIIDWKTTSNFRYANTPEDLMTDPQAISYALSVFRKYPEADEFDVTFVYIQTSNKVKVNVKPVTVTLTRDHCEAEFNKIKKDIKQMLTLSVIQDPDKIPRNLENCMAFGKLCMHAPYCDRVEQGILDKGKQEVTPNRFTHPELFRKKKKKKKDPVSLRPPEVKEKADDE